MTNVLQKSYILHQYKYKEHSVILKLITDASGLLTAVARNAKKTLSPWYGLTQPLQPIQVILTGKSELLTVKHIEPYSTKPSLNETEKICALYANELLLRLLPNAMPLPNIFSIYEQLIYELGNNIEISLREFELSLLSELGYAPTLAMDNLGQAVDPKKNYTLQPNSLPTIAATKLKQIIFSGEELLNINAKAWSRPGTLLSAQKLTRSWINYYLNGKILQSRKLMQALKQLEVIN